VRIFLASDTHGRPAVPATLPARARDQGADVVVLAGDISQRGRPSRYVHDLVQAFAPLPVLAVPGNMDPVEVHGQAAEAGAHWLHASRAQVLGRWWAGFGGSTPHFGWLGGPFQIPEEEIAAGLTVAQPGDILVVHNPPRGILDQTGFLVRAGSHAILDAVKRVRPPLVLSGHVHEARGAERQDGTLFVNAGTGKKLYSALIDWPDGGEPSAELFG
jgi:Icc-related predicted phosphoesterase